ncbi:MAG: hypothetical protein ACJ79N_01280 [Gemmatimonadaceae bacterium]
MKVLLSKAILVVCACGLLLACGNSTEPRAAQGTAYFKFDGVSCAYTGTKAITFYVGDDEVGTENMIGDATSAAYLTKATDAYPPSKRGNPVVQARIANYTASGGALWTYRVAINVPVNASVTHIFTC